MWSALLLFLFVLNFPSVRWTRDELSYVFLQVKLLHAALEQEKSKVKGLQSDQPKHQVRIPLVSPILEYHLDIWVFSRKGRGLRPWPAGIHLTHDVHPTPYPRLNYNRIHCTCIEYFLQLGFFRFPPNLQFAFVVGRATRGARRRRRAIYEEEPRTENRVHGDKHDEEHAADSLFLDVFSPFCFWEKTKMKKHVFILFPSLTALCMPTPNTINQDILCRHPPPLPSHP